MENTLPFGVVGMEQAEYNGKRYSIPLFDVVEPVVLHPNTQNSFTPPDALHPIIASLHQPFDIEQFKIPRTPLSLGVLTTSQVAVFAAAGAQRVLDMPVKFPDGDVYRLPRAFRQFAFVLQQMIDYEHRINDKTEEYYAYLTIDQGVVAPQTLQREAPCHVDGFQGARWQPKVAGNHTYTVSDVLPTAYYVQPFDFSGLSEDKHDFFWEMNAQVADTREAYKWQPREAEMTLMDCYSVHRGVQAPVPMHRTWMRLSFEERSRKFDRLGNAHNPLFDYDWDMVERDIEQLHLVPFRTNADPSLSVFPWQDVDGLALPHGVAKTQPRLS